MEGFISVLNSPRLSTADSSESDSFSILTLENIWGKGTVENFHLFSLLCYHRSNTGEDRLADLQTLTVIAEQQALTFHSFLVEWLHSV